jgi:hypothetical protein
VAFTPLPYIYLEYYALLEIKLLKGYMPPNTKSARYKAYAEISEYASIPELALLNSQNRLKKWILVFFKDKCILNEEIKEKEA